MSGSFQPFSLSMRPIACSCGKVTVTPMTQRPTAAEVTSIIRNRKLLVPNSRLFKIAAKAIRCESAQVNVIHVSDNCFDVVCQCGFMFRVFVKDSAVSLAQVGVEGAHKFDDARNLLKIFPVPVRNLFNCNLRGSKSGIGFGELPEGEEINTEMEDLCSVDCDFEVMFSKPKSAFVGSFRSLPTLLSSDIMTRK